MALDIESPLDAIRTHWSSIGGTAKSEDLPALRYMSDLVWGKYVEGNPNVKNLHAYVVHNILNDETSAIVSRVLRNKQISKLSVWPGIVLDKDKDPVEFQATIGMSFGYIGLVYFISSSRRLLTTCRLPDRRHDGDLTCTTQG